MKNIDEYIIENNLNKSYSSLKILLEGLLAFKLILSTYFFILLVKNDIEMPIIILFLIIMILIAIVGIIISGYSFQKVIPIDDNLRLKHIEDYEDYILLQKNLEKAKRGIK